MTRSLLTILLVAWAALALPSICRAGMLEHACACGVSSDCTHEESCGSDPCSVSNPSTAAKLVSVGSGPEMPSTVECLQVDTQALATDLLRDRARSILSIAPSLHPGVHPLRN